MLLVFFLHVHSFQYVRIGLAILSSQKLFKFLSIDNLLHIVKNLKKEYKSFFKMFAFESNINFHFWDFLWLGRVTLKR